VSSDVAGGGAAAPDAGGLIAPMAALAPLAGALGALAPVAGVATPVLADGASLLMPGVLSLPTVPGLPIPLPTQVGLPQDLICAGTGWSATTPSEVPHAAPPAEARRGDW
jgi:hypothetical protein